MAMSRAFLPIIGLEVHVQLATQSKLFCRCGTSFGGEPNTQTCPVCLGLPGSLPVMNAEAFRLALKAAVALHCEIPQLTKWDRKQYFYPDLPKGYQISQYDIPMSFSGYVVLPGELGQGSVGGKRVGIIRAHLEEDAGKSMHDERSATADSRIDLNRAGTPLLEIVTAPEMSSAAEAKAFLTELRLMLTYLAVSDCNMQEGSLRVDANVNLKVGEEGIFTPIVEIKNMNSFRAVERAIEHEIERQREVFERTGDRKGDQPKQTRGWDDDAGATYAMRGKEESSDYRYFPDPDLVPVLTSAGEVEDFRRNLGTLPEAHRRRLREEFALSLYDTEVLVGQGPGVMRYFLEVVERCGDPKQASNWLQRDVLRWIHGAGISIEAFPIAAEELAHLIRGVREGTWESSRAGEVFAHMAKTGDGCTAAVAALGIQPVSDDSIQALCEEILRANPKIVAELREGKDKGLGALIGLAKRKNPNINPSRFREMCLRVLPSLPI